MSTSKRFHFEIRTSGAIALLSAWLAAVSLTACENTVDFVPKGKACVVACGEENPAGLDQFNTLSIVCACKRCSADCSKSVCTDKQPPSDECLPCVQESLRGRCHNAGLFTAGCESNKSCRAYILCLDACEGGTQRGTPLRDFLPR